MEMSVAVACVTSRLKYLIVGAQFSSLPLPPHKRLPFWSSRSLGVFDHQNPAAALQRARSLSIKSWRLSQSLVSLCNLSYSG